MFSACSPIHSGQPREGRNTSINLRHPGNTAEAIRQARQVSSEALFRATAPQSILQKSMAECLVAPEQEIVAPNHISRAAADLPLDPGGQCDLELVTSSFDCERPSEVCQKKKTYKLRLCFLSLEPYQTPASSLASSTRSVTIRPAGVHAYSTVVATARAAGGWRCGRQIPILDCAEMVACGCLNLSRYREYSMAFLELASRDFSLLMPKVSCHIWPLPGEDGLLVRLLSGLTALQFFVSVLRVVCYPSPPSLGMQHGNRWDSNG
jgi:hypothetical protein